MVSVDGAGKPVEEKGDLLDWRKNKLTTTVFVEPPLALPESNKAPENNSSSTMKNDDWLENLTG